MFWVVSLMLVRLLIWLITLSYFVNLLTVVFLCLLFVCCYVGIVHNKLSCDGVLVSLNHFVFQMVFDRACSVLSPFLFAVCLDGLLSELSDSGVGCYWGHLFAGAVCYADNIVLLAPCPSALRTLLRICSGYASSHGLEFNK